MASTNAALREAPGPAADLPAVRLAVLARAAADGGVGKAELLRELAPLLTPRLPQSDARHAIERGLAALIMTGLVREDRARFHASEAGQSALAPALGLKSLPARTTWALMHDVWLTARALGLAGLPAARLKRLAKPDGLRIAVVQQAYKLPVRPDAAPAKVRSQLAVIALERAFGNKIKSGFDEGGLSAKAARLLAGQLAATPRDFGTDARLVAALAAEQAGAKSTDAAAIRAAVLRRWLGQGAEQEAARSFPAPAPLSPPPMVAANDAAESRPDLAQFAQAVRAGAARVAEGWPGNRKAFISLVAKAIRETHPLWRLTDIEFKCMLAEAHRAGLVVLATADLKDKRTEREVQASAIAYKNTVWHQVRVEE